MKNSIIYEKKKITIGELINIFNTNLIWFFILGINLMSNYFVDWFLNNKIDCKLCTSESNCTELLEFFIDKLIFSRKIIYFGFIINLLLMISYNKIRQLIPNIFQLNNSISMIPIWLFIFSSLMYKPVLTYFINYNADKLNELVVIIFYYLFFEMLSLGILFLLLILLIILLIDYIYTKINDFYKSTLKDITLEYTELKFIDIEKNI
jgi:hypothetical protein